MVKLVTILVFFLSNVFLPVSHAKDFPFGIYGAWSVQDYDKAFSVASGKGFTIVEVPAKKDLIDKCRQYHLKALASFNLTEAVARDENLLRAFETAMVERVRELLEHPAIFGWYLVDEPNVKGIDPETVYRLYQRIKSVDRNRPVYTYLAYPGTWEDYLRSADIIGISGYLRKGETVKVIRKRIDSLRRDLRKSGLVRETWLVLQAFDYRYRGRPSPYKSISVHEFRESWNLALKKDIDGLMVYTLGSLPRSTPIEPFSLPRDRPDLWQEIDILKKEIDHLNRNEEN